MDRRTKIIEILAAVTKKKIAPDPDESLFESGILDSFSLTDLLSELEKAFGVQIPDSDLNPRKFESVARIEQYIESRQ